MSQNYPLLTKKICFTTEVVKSNFMFFNNVDKSRASYSLPKNRIVSMGNDISSFKIMSLILHFYSCVYISKVDY